MPRLPHSLLLRARNISSLLPLVLRGARSLDSAINELRWLREHVEEICVNKPEEHFHRTLFRLCKRRSRGEPLQYILRSQPFGDLDIECKPGVLIPRPETEACTIHLAGLLVQERLRPLTEGTNQRPRQSDAQSSLKIVDLCTGTGCIPLLLHSQLTPTFKSIRCMGWDISKDAVSLARANLTRNELLKNITAPDSQSSPSITFERVDIFSDFTDQQLRDLKCDVLVSNPPYISHQSFKYETTRSVRNWEPKLALVPSIPQKGGCLPQDVFYDRLLHLHLKVCGSRILLMEVGDDEQAIRVAQLAIGRLREDLDASRVVQIELWRDSPDSLPLDNELQEYDLDGYNINVRGSGTLRAVVLVS
ncbi:S-adenosyl-L-methionine-dependent methyltransferase [Glarea lozoyensis ATCC 20868]|uniref:peptide chain release factor N(5)-glutamine methyltransferase n=1 Tax=Glarea lozoyensis (strain ATCC 20868 / MF5171) TaxID=1116229 RepID=S3DDA1_GLAL2|nr:S-adenosyl-L-methionine-dependent methyltransferase [Glarea lozoyensis ATCC 20868]EPE29971.1 S-adenosyl-L-methionine-dependent methyltransferase [Glarea lozoyensis ATCC 20868]